MKKFFNGFFTILIFTLMIYVSSTDMYSSEITAKTLIDEYMQIEAERLDEMGLFKGTDNGYELELPATRAMGAVMLVRFMGAEGQAEEELLSTVISHPFRDVPKWADAHVAYLYSNGMTNGISSDFFGSNDILTVNQYSTMLLRMLNYEDGDVDFNWDDAVDFIKSTYPIETRILNNIEGYDDVGIHRGLLVELSYTTLDFWYKDSSITVFEQLFTDKVVSVDKFSKYYTKLNEYDSGLIDEIKGIWFSYIELKPMLLNKTEGEFRGTIRDSFEKVKETGFNRVYIQVRPFADAIYPSTVYPWSYILTGVEGEDPGYDPLAICIEEAKLLGLNVEAWINPYRVRTDITKVPISEFSSINALVKSNPNSVIYTGNLATMNPAVKEVRELIVKGIEEIINKYDIDGIQFDDYFYPNNDLTLDIEEYENYKESGGVLSHSDFRILQTTTLVREVHDAIKKVNPNILFGISPQGNMTNNLEMVFIDTKAWVDYGYIDYLMPQVYYGFDNSHSPFKIIINEWNELVKLSDCRLIIGLAGYKVGRLDSWAGEGANEWIDKESILSDMVSSSRELSEYKGIAIFRYSSLYEPVDEVSLHINKEIEGLQKLFVK